MFNKIKRRTGKNTYLTNGALTFTCAGEAVNYFIVVFNIKIRNVV